MSCVRQESPLSAMSPSLLCSPASSLVFLLFFQFSHNYVRHLIYRKQKVLVLPPPLLARKLLGQDSPLSDAFLLNSLSAFLGGHFAMVLGFSGAQDNAGHRRTRLLMWENVTIPAPPAKSCQRSSRNCSFCLSVRPIQGLCRCGVSYSRGGDQ